MSIDYQRIAAVAERHERIKAAAKRFIWVTFQKEGIHCYPAAGAHSELRDVSFLAFPHRHIFHFTVAIEVTHNDRDIEFIQFKRWLESLYAGDNLALDYKSCEMIADELFTQIANKYDNRDVKITVSEDGENGCTIEYNTTQATQLTVI